MNPPLGIVITSAKGSVGMIRAQAPRKSSLQPGAPRSARTPTELTALLATGEDKLTSYGTAEQLELELSLPTDDAALPRARAVVGSPSSVLIDAIAESWELLGFSEVVDDRAFFDFMLARLVAPTSKADLPPNQGRDRNSTVVFTALAIERCMQVETGVSLKKIITYLQPLREFTGQVGGQDIKFALEVTGSARKVAAVLLPERFRRGVLK